MEWLKIDTRTVAPFAPARFIVRYSWAAETDRCVVFYTARVFGRDWQIREEIRHSLAGQFRHEWETQNLNPDSPFIRYFFNDVPHLLHNWQHICRAARWQATA
jgi:hypothetical protein